MSEVGEGDFTVVRKLQVMSLPEFCFPQEEDGRVSWAEALGLLYLGVVRSRRPKTMGWRAGRRVPEGGAPTGRSRCAAVM